MEYINTRSAMFDVKKRKMEQEAQYQQSLLKEREKECSNIRGRLQQLEQLYNELLHEKEMKHMENNRYITRIEELEAELLERNMYMEQKTSESMELNNKLIDYQMRIDLLQTKDIREIQDESFKQLNEMKVKYFQQESSYKSQLEQLKNVLNNYEQIQQSLTAQNQQLTHELHMKVNIINEYSDYYNNSNGNITNKTLNTIDIPSNTTVSHEDIYYNNKGNNNNKDVYENNVLDDSGFSHSVGGSIGEDSQSSSMQPKQITEQYLSGLLGYVNEQSLLVEGNNLPSITASDNDNNINVNQGLSGNSAPAAAVGMYTERENKLIEVIFRLNKRCNKLLKKYENIQKKCDTIQLPTVYDRNNIHNNEVDARKESEIIQYVQKDKQMQLHIDNLLHRIDQYKEEIVYRDNTIVQLSTQVQHNMQLESNYRLLQLTYDQKLNEFQLLESALDQWRVEFENKLKYELEIKQNESNIQLEMLKLEIEKQCSFIYNLEAIRDNHPDTQKWKESLYVNQQQQLQLSHYEIEIHKLNDIISDKDRDLSLLQDKINEMKNEYGKSELKAVDLAIERNNEYWKNEIIILKEVAALQIHDLQEQWEITHQVDLDSRISDNISRLRLNWEEQCRKDMMEKEESWKCESERLLAFTTATLKQECDSTIKQLENKYQLLLLEKDKCIHDLHQQHASHLNQTLQDVEAKYSQLSEKQLIAFNEQLLQASHSFKLREQQLVTELKTCKDTVPNMNNYISKSKAKQLLVQVLIYIGVCVLRSNYYYHYRCVYIYRMN